VHPRPQARLVVEARGALREAARQCEAEVFLDRFGNTAEELAEEYGPYEERTIFLAVVEGEDGAADVLASARIVLPVPLPKTLADAGREPWLADPPRVVREVGLDLDRTWDVLTFAVRRGVRGRGVHAFEALIYGVIEGMAANGAEWMVAMVDDGPRRLLAERGVDLDRLPGTWTAPYFGSPATTPVYARQADMAAGRRRVGAPEGGWAHGVALPPPEALRVAPRPGAAPALVSGAAPASGSGSVLGQAARRAHRRRR
jgi:hypothetical protein